MVAVSRRKALAGRLCVCTSTRAANPDAAIFEHVLAGDVPDEAFILGLEFRGLDGI